MPDPYVIYAIIGLALIFDFVNGFHDAANSIATVVCTRVLTPLQAVLWAGFFNFAAYWVFGTKVAGNIAKGVNTSSFSTNGVVAVVAAALIGAVIWNLITWYFGIPSSSSHALMGGVGGAAAAGAGFGVLSPEVFIMTVVFIFVAPIMGLVLGHVFMQLMYFLFRNSTPTRVGKLFARLQLVSAAAYSLGHGGNDAQKTAGIIFVLLTACKMLPEDTKVPPEWVMLACYGAMGLGTLFGGWRIVKTMGQRICRLQPVHGFAAEAAGAVSLYTATHFGIPVSTTHVITGAIFGVGSTRGIHAVKWNIAGRVLWAWILTIPFAGGVAALLFCFFRAMGWAGEITPPPVP